MKITLYAVGKLGKSYWRAAQEDYLERLRHYARVELREVKDVAGRGRTAEEHQIEESNRILEAVPRECTLVALDRRGRQMSSEEFARFLQEHQVRSTRELGFAVGGPFGFTQDLLSRAQTVLSFSEMTLPHELARIVLLEQLYRGFTILRGEKYHK